jgi:hypothetical protein
MLGGKVVRETKLRRACTSLLSHRSLHLTAFITMFDLFIEPFGHHRSLHLTAITSELAPYCFYTTFDLFIERVSIGASTLLLTRQRLTSSLSRSALKSTLFSLFFLFQLCVLFQFNYAKVGHNKINFLLPGTVRNEHYS